MSYMNDTRIDKLDTLILLAKDSILDRDMDEIEATDTSDMEVDTLSSRYRAGKRLK